MNKKQALQIVGGLSRPGKMPGFAYGLPAKECAVGSKLRNISGSTCADCYAMKGCYVFSVVQAAQYRRLESLQNPQWRDAMVTLLRDQDYFRWHDSGDLQSFEHLAMIVDICQRTPNCQHWLPTREVKIVRQFVRCTEIPANLTIRISATMIDDKAANVATDWNKFLPTSTVHQNKPAIGFECLAPQQGGTCADCRMCWDNSVSNISYRRH